MASTYDRMSDFLQCLSQAHDQRDSGAALTTKTHQAWKDSATGDVVYWDTSWGATPPGLAAGSELLWEFEASSGEEAMSIHFVRLGIAPYLPNGTASPCPKCGAQYYPEGYAECWRCGPVDSGEVPFLSD